MNVSFDDQASQLTSCNDQQSETLSSANLTSPHSFNYSASSTSLNHTNSIQNHHHPKNQTVVPSNDYLKQHHQYQHLYTRAINHEAYNLYANTRSDNAASTSYNNHPSELNHQHNQQPNHHNKYHLNQQQQQQQQLTETPLPHRNTFSNQQHQKQPQSVQRNLFQVPKRACTGVDKLILAAMMNEAYGGQLPPHIASTPTCPTSTYLPSGRGLGYFPNSTQSQYPSQIPTPSNKSELELYRLLERANLLNYFGTFLNFGGDDVQQLCDADEEEFLEIMSLVGMTQKPLHVRRLQKALIEWRENKEMESNFRRPHATTNLHHHNSSANNNQKLLGKDGLNSNRHVASSTSIVESPQSNPPSISSRSSEHYALPQELIGAPKRIRLMDDLHKKPVPEASPNREEAGNHSRLNHCNLSCDITNGRPKSPLLASSPKRSSINKEGGVDDDDDDADNNEDVEQDEEEDDDEKSIEVMDSSHSDLELDESVTNATCGSIMADQRKEYSHNKYGRYKASLQSAKSPNNLKL